MNNGLKALTFTSLAHFANDGTAFMFPVLIVYYTQLVPVAVLGSLAIIYEVISGLLSMRVGSLADAGDRDNSLISLGIGILAGSVIAFALSFMFRQYLYEFLLLGIVMLGIGQAFYHPLGATVLSQSFGRERAPSALGLNGAIASSGRAVMPFIMVSMFAIIGIGTGLGVISIYMFAAALAIYFGLKFFHREKSKPVSGSTIPEKKAQIGAYRSFLLLLTIIVFIRSMFMMGVTTFAPTYLTSVLNSKSLMSILLSVSLLTSVFGQPIFGYFTSLKGGKFTIALSSLFSVIGFFIFLFTKSFVVIFFGYALFTFMAFTGFPVLLGYVGQVVPREFSTRSNSMVWGVGNTVGGAAGIAVYTVLYPYIGLADAMWIMLLFAIISGMMLPLLPAKSKKYETVT